MSKTTFVYGIKYCAFRKRLSKSLNRKIYELCFTEILIKIQVEEINNVNTGIICFSEIKYEMNEMDVLILINDFFMEFIFFVGLVINVTNETFMDNIFIW